MEKTLVIIKPDAVNRGLIGEVLHRFERKGLKVIGLKMQHLSEKVLEEHYSHLSAKPFFKGLKEFMKSAPSILLAVEGNKAVEVVRQMCGETSGAKALPGTIRGDFYISTQSNIVHASDSIESAEKEIKRFFKEGELFKYRKFDLDLIYAEDERK